jgi:CAAX protease family protein
VVTVSSSAIESPAAAPDVLALRPRPGWVRGACAAAVMTVLYLFAVPLLGVLPVFALPHADHLARGIVAAVGMGIVAALVLIVSFEVLFASRRRDLRPYGFARPTHVWSTLGMGIPLAVVALFAGLAIAQGLGLGGTTTPNLHRETSGDKVLFSFLAIVIAPWLEEVSVRGLLFSSLNGRFGFWIAAIGSGFLWAGLHFVALVIIPFTLVGIVLAFIRRRSDSVLPGMLLHGTQNTWASVLGAGAGWYMAPMPFILLATIAATWWWLPAARPAAQ